MNAIDLKAMTATDLNTIDKAIATVDKARSGLGAVQNRFTSAINNLNNTSNNLFAAQSRIRDADYATEVSNMSRAQILQQAGTSVLSQANQFHRPFCLCCVNITRETPLRRGFYLCYLRIRL